MGASDDNEDDESAGWWRLSWRQIFALGLVVGLLAQPASSALLAVFSGTVEVSGTVPLQANSGLTVKTDENLTSTSPFPASDTVRVEHPDGAANYSSSPASRAMRPASRSAARRPSTTGLSTSSLRARGAPATSHSRRTARRGSSTG